LKSRNVRGIGYRQGQQKKRVIPAGIAQLGQKQGNHFTNGSTGRKESSYGGVTSFGGTGYRSELGNEAALNCAGNKAKPGCDRTIYKSGSMGTHGAPASGNPMPVNRSGWPYGK